MRLVVLFAALLAVPAAHAQAQFMASCVASAASDDSVEVDPEEVCQCAATDAMTRGGLTVATLDEVVPYLGEETIDPATVPEATRASVGIVMESLVQCVVASSLESALSTPAAASVDAPETGAAPVASPPVASATPAAPQLPSGLRTGNGKEAGRAMRAGPGAVVRIVE